MTKRLAPLLALLAAQLVRGQDPVGPALCLDGTSTGYSSATDLISDLSIENGEFIYSICPNTVLELADNDSILISSSVVINCGEDGSSAHNCIIRGGQIQVDVSGDGSQVEFFGVTFTESALLSAHIRAHSSFVTFTDCSWENHMTSLVLIERNSTESNETSADDTSIEVDPLDPMSEVDPENPPDNGTTIEIEPLPPDDFVTETVNDVVDQVTENVVEGAKSLSRKRPHSHHHPSSRTLQSTPTVVAFFECQLTHNDVEDSLFINEDGALVVRDSAVAFNNGTRVLIMTRGEGTLQISNVTFLNNEAPIAFLGEKATLELNEANCGDMLGIEECNGIYTQNDSIPDCESDFSLCIGECIVFDGDDCPNSLDVVDNTTIVDNSTTIVPEENVTEAPSSQAGANETTSIAPSLAPIQSGITPAPVSEMDTTPSPTQVPSNAETETATSAPSISPSLNAEADTAAPTETPSSSETTSLLSVECPTNSTLTGYTDLASIEADLLMGVVFFEICPGTVLEGSLELLLTDSVLVVECFDDSCIWVGDGSHMKLGGANFGVRSAGITFRNATDSSVVIKYDSESEPDFIFFDCVWEGIRGDVVFSIEHTSALDLTGDSEERSLQESRHELVNCYFYDNNVGDVVYVDDSEIDINNCSFVSNQANASIVAVLDTNVDITDTEFVGNSFRSSQGLVHVGGSSELTSDGICGISNAPFDEADDTCNGLKSESGECTSLDECEVPCLDTWSNLVIAAEARMSLLVICENTTLTVLDNVGPMELSANNTVVRCGFNGDDGEGCVVKGGRDQIIINAHGVVISDLSMVESTRSSIRAEAGEAVIHNCTFSGHVGEAVIMNYRDAGSSLDSSDGTLASLAEPSGVAADLTVTSCSFMKNGVTLAPIVVAKGLLALNDTIFQENVAAAGGISILYGGELNMASSCFAGNTGLATVVSVDEFSTVTRNEDNFGIGSELSSDSAGCDNGISVDSDGCSPFGARFCGSSLADPAVLFSEFSSCIDNLDDLIGDVADTDGSDEIVICPLTSFDIDEPVRVENSNTTVVCGSDGSRLNGCLFVGGASHVAINGNVLYVTFSGITFQGASEVSVTIEGSSPMSVDFEDCAWEENRGEYVVSISSSDPITTSPTGAPSENDSTDDIFGTDDFFEGRRLEQNGVLVTIAHSSFASNVVDKSLISNNAAVLALPSCVFTDNEVEDGVISLASGRITMMSSCFDGNVFDSESGLIELDAASMAESDFSNFETNNGGRRTGGCNGFFDMSTGDCQDFNATYCGAPGAGDCFSTWDELSVAMDAARSLGLGSLFVLCPDTALEAQPFGEISIDIDETILQCGTDGDVANLCSVVGGTVQFVISGDGVEFRGVTLVGSSVAAIHATGTDTAKASLLDCVFSGHTGVAAVIAYNGDIQGASSTGADRRLQSSLEDPDPTMSLEVRNGVFTDNNVEYSPLAIAGGSLTLESTTFVDNTGQSEGIGVWFDGDATLTSSCADSNQTDTIFVDSGSTVDGSFETDCDVVVPPSQACYTSWMELGSAVMSSMTQSQDDVIFVICANTTLDADEDINEEFTPVSVNGVEVTIQCGDDGERDSNCTIQGGKAHFKLEGPGNVNFNGLTFEDATFASILATGDVSAVASFEECTWRQNSGEAILLVHNEANSGDVFSGDMIDYIGAPGEAQTVLMDRCSFENNDATFATISVVAGEVNILETIIVNNRNSRFGAIAAVANAVLGLSFACMTGNSALERGILYIDNESTLAFNANSFGADNDVQLDNCTAVYKETSGSCVELGTCEGDCQAFESKTCRVVAFEVDSTISPTVAPSTFPSSIQPSSVPGGPEDGGGGGGGGSNAGVLSAAIIVPLLLIGLGAGYVFYKRKGKGKSGGGDGGDEDADADIPTTIGGDASRSKTQAEDGDASYDSEDDLRIPLNDTAINQDGATASVDNGYDGMSLDADEGFEDEPYDPLAAPPDHVVPLKAEGGGGRFSMFRKSASNSNLEGSID